MKKCFILWDWTILNFIWFWLLCVFLLITYLSSFMPFFLETRVWRFGSIFHITSLHDPNHSIAIDQVPWFQVILVFPGQPLPCFPNIYKLRHRVNQPSLQVTRPNQYFKRWCWHSSKTSFCSLWSINLPKNHKDNLQ